MAANIRIQKNIGLRIQVFTNTIEGNYKKGAYRLQSGLSRGKFKNAMYTHVDGLHDLYTVCIHAVYA